jgi:putative addiction module killer protein
MLPIKMLDLRYFITSDGRSPFEDWFAALDAQAAAKITIALVKLGQGNLSNVKGVGEGVFEYKIDWAAGYRVYFGRDGQVLVILLNGGTKKRQTLDINNAKKFWQEYKRRKLRRKEERE